MNQIVGETLSDTTIELDGTRYEGCRFVRCKIVYRGLADTGLRNNEFEDCSFAFEGAASRTMAFLKGMVGSSDGFLVTFLKTLDLDPRRLDGISAEPARGLKPAVDH